MRRFAVVASVVLVACSSDQPADPEALDPVLGAVGASPEEARAAGLELAAHDLERFRRAGLENPEAVLPGLVRELVAPGSWTGARRVEVNQGKLLLVHQAEVVAEAGRLLDAILDRADRGVSLEVEIREVPAGAEEGRALARLSFGLANGRWSRQKSSSSRFHVGGLDLEDGRAALRTQDLSEGVVSDAAVWRDPLGGGVLHLLLTLRAEAEPPVAVDVGAAGDSPAYAIELPRPVTIQFRGQIGIEPGPWREFARMPSPREGHSLLAVARARWSPVLRQEVGPVTILPVALPEGHEPEEAEGWLFSDRNRDQVLFGEEWQDVAAKAQESETTTVQNVAFQIASSGGLQSLGVDHRGLDPGEGGGTDAPPLFPSDLVESWDAIRRAEWNPDHHLAFAWDHVFVRQTPEVVGALAGFLDRFHQWRNQTYRLRVQPVSLDPHVLEVVPRGALPADLADALRNRPTSGPVDVVLRAGTWTRVSTERESAYVAGHLVPGRTTPPLATAREGLSLAVRPRRYGDGRLEFEIRWTARRVDPASLEPTARAGGTMQSPRTREEELGGILVAGEGGTWLLVGSAAGADELPGLLVEMTR